MNHRIKSEIQSYYEFWFGLNEIYERWAKAHGITSNTLFVIHTINEYPDRCTPSVLCKCLLLSKQTVNSILNRLERDGYIQRSEAQMCIRDRSKTVETAVFPKGQSLLRKTDVTDRDTPSRRHFNIIARMFNTVHTGKYFVQIEGSNEVVQQHDQSEPYGEFLLGGEMGNNEVQQGIRLMSKWF